MTSTASRQQEVGVRVPTQLRALAAGQRIVRVSVPSPTSVGDALAGLAASYPGLHHAALDERGLVRQHVNIFVDADNIRFGAGLATPVPPGAELSILPAVSGG